MESYMKEYFSFAALVLILSGCATCEQHPVACGIAGAVIVGTVAAGVQHHHDQQESRGIQQRFGFCTNPGNPECK
jgi:hypothetical protein